MLSRAEWLLILFLVAKVYTFAEVTKQFYMFYNMFLIFVQKKSLRTILTDIGGEESSKSNRNTTKTMKTWKKVSLLNLLVDEPYHRRNDAYANYYNQ